MSKNFFDQRYFQNLNSEVKTLIGLNHNNIIKIVEIKKTHHHYFIIFEYCNGGTLKSCLEKYKNIYNRPFTEKIVQHIMRQIVSAVKYIHDLNIIHRNLSLENIVVNFEKEIDKTQVNLLK